MTTKDREIQEHLAAAQKAEGEASLALREFLFAIQHFEWERAEAARLRYTAQIENHLDHLVEANRCLERAKPKP